MKKIVLLFMVLYSITACAQEAQKLNSKVISATVFKNRALVTREAAINLTSGSNKVVISSLPVDLLNESMRVAAEGGGTIKILDVKVEQRFTAETQQSIIKSLEQKIDSLTQLKFIASDKAAVYQSQKEFIESLKTEYSKYLRDKSAGNMTIGSWNEMLKYLETNLAEVYAGIREQNRKIAAYDAQINSIRQEINLSQGQTTKSYKEVVITLETNRAGSVKLYPSYIVQSANWYPVYDIRVDSDTKNAELSYFGMVNQSTGEDWKDIALTLSTAEPMSVKSLPELDTWFIDVNPVPIKYSDDNRTVVNQNYQINYNPNYGLPAGTGSVSGYIIDSQTGEPLIGANAIVQGTSLGSATDRNGRFLISNINAGYYNLVFSYIGYEQVNLQVNVLEKNVAEVTIPMSPPRFDKSEMSMIERLPQTSVNSMLSLSAGVVKEVSYVSVKANELSTTFEVPVKSTIPSDNSQHKVTIAVTNTPVEFSYTSIPKISQSVYLKGKITNKNEYPLLEGEINIFVDNDFINRTSMNTIVPTDTLSLALGIDDKIQIKKVLINKFQESKGLLGGSKQVTYEYEIQITNNRNTQVSISVYDQIPVVMNENIEVELLEPGIEEKSLPNDKKLEWNVTLQPGEKKTIPLKYKVSFPNNVNVYGLE